MEEKTFKDFGLKQSILDALEKKWYTSPTQIQYEVISRFASWNHIVWQSQTGTGKTAAFVIPLINAIDPRKKWLQAIVMCPTRELVVQTEDEFYKLSRWSVGFKAWVAYGGWGMRHQIEKIQQWCQVLIATPWRLIDLIHRGVVRTEAINYFVLDEADRMLDMGFVDDIDHIVEKCANIKQFLSFSATITPELNRILTQYIWREYDFIKTSSEVVVDKVDHTFMHVSTVNKLALLDKTIKQHEGQKILIFTQTKLWASDVVRNLRQWGHDALEIHWDIDQRGRLQIIKKFKSWELMILVATDVAARWLNLNDVDLVINFEVPQDPESYVHRIGRTARAWKSWKALMFVDHFEQKAVDVIERRNKLTIKQIDEHGQEVVRQQRWPRFGWWSWQSRWGYRGRSWWWYQWNSSRGWYQWWGSSYQWGGSSYQWSNSNDRPKSDTAWYNDRKRYAQDAGPAKWWYSSNFDQGYKARSRGWR